jgi:hypothetical protein
LPCRRIISTAASAASASAEASVHLTRNAASRSTTSSAPHGARRRETVTVDKDHHADLFWAIRVGGGNFGVVTEFQVPRASDPHRHRRPMLWPLERSKEILQWYADFLPKQPDELNGFFAFLTVPPGPPFPEALH